MTLFGLDEVADLPAERVGGKARGLGRLLERDERHLVAAAAASSRCM